MPEDLVPIYFCFDFLYGNMDSFQLMDGSSAY